ncbi:restriction endonuclease subunit S, partial [Anaerosalibacter bizertensis]|nr:restriction endonuclease subunit S [Anaerosalibacter bizertensis]
MKLEEIVRKSNWDLKKISDVTFYQEGPGVRKKQYTEEGVKLLNVGNIQKGKIDLSLTDRYISEEEAYGKYEHFLADEGDLIIACSGIQVSYFHEKIAFLKKEHLPLCMNTSTMRFKSLDEGILDINYFSYFLKTNYFKKQLQKLITGSAQLNFGPSHIEQIDIMLPPIKIQKKIVEVLDEAQKLIDN